MFFFFSSAVVPVFLAIPNYITMTIEARNATASNSTLYFVGMDDLAKAHDGLLPRINMWLYSVRGTSFASSFPDPNLCH